MSAEIQRVKSLAWTALKGIALVIVIVWFFKNCTGCGNHIATEKRDMDSLFKKNRIDSLEKVKLKRGYDSLEVKLNASRRIEDSLMKVSHKFENKYLASSKAVRDLLKYGVCDSVKVLVALNDCDSIIEANHNVIASKDTTINTLIAEKNNLLKTDSLNKEIIATSRNIISGQAQDYTDLKTASKKALRKQKVITWLVIIGDAIKDAALIFLMND